MNFDFIKQILKDSEIKQAKTEWNEKAKTFEGQKEIIEKAGNGDITASNYIFILFAPYLYKSLLWLYGGSTTLMKEEYNNGDLTDNILYAYFMVKGGTHNDFVNGMKGVREGSDGSYEYPNPYETFDVNKYDENANLLNSFCYWLNQYYRTQIRAIRINASKKDVQNKDNTHNGGEDVIVGFEKDDDNEDGRIDLGSEDKNYRDVENKQLIDDLIERLQNDDSDKINSIIAYILDEVYNKNTPIEDIADYLNMDMRKIRRISYKAVDLIQQYA